MLHKKNFAILIIILLSLYILFYTKYSVHKLTYQKNELQKLLYIEKEKVRILNAEFIMLKNVNRIKKIINNNVASIFIKETDPKQMVFDKNNNIILKINNSFKSGGSWRYKSSKPKI